MKSTIILVILSAIISCSGCSGIKLLSSKDYYSDKFLKKIETVQSIYRDGLKSEALAKLNELDDNSLKDVEKAKKYNFIGIIKFSNDDIQGAITEFEKANGYRHDFEELKSQIRLNLASCFYKLDQYEYSKNYIRQINADALKRQEGEKYAKLKIAVFQRLGQNEEVISGIFYMGKPLKTFNDVKQFDYLSLLKSSFAKLSDSKRIYILEDNTDNILAAYLAKEEAFKRMILGDKEGMRDIVDWLDNKFSHIPEVRDIIEDYNSNLQNYTKIDARSIGVILPMSEKDKSKFASKTMYGVEAAVNYSKNKDFITTLHIQDSFDNPAVSAKAVRELVLKNNVSVIIGGLFSSNAKAQYLEARKYGVLFISLSTVDLPKNEKSPLLIEIPGSIQSQISALTDPNFLNEFGKNVALFYPNNQRGNIYANELWNLNEEKVLNITSINNFDPQKKDLRDPVGQLLGLKYQRQRSEELKIWKDIYDLKEKKSSARRRQFLKPVIDFDWIFIPAYPNTAVQAIPTFKWYDAKDLKFFGIPSWGSSAQLMREQSNLGNINLVGDNLKGYDLGFSNEFSKRNNKRVSLLEINGFEAMDIATNLLRSLKFTDRGEFSRALISKTSIKGKTGKWNLVNNLWIKEMSYLNLTSRGGAQKIDLKE